MHHFKPLSALKGRIEQVLLIQSSGYLTFHIKHRAIRFAVILQTVLVEKRLLRKVYFYLRSCASMHPRYTVLPVHKKGA